MTLLLKFAPYIAAALLLLGVGAWSAHKVDQSSYNRLQSQYSAFQLKVSQNAAAAQKAASDALQAQLDARAQQDKVNADAISTLQTQNAAIAADRDHTLTLVHRLLNRPDRPAAPGGSEVPQAGDHGESEARGASGDERLAGLLADAHDECQRNAGRLDALISQLQPQL